MGPQRLSGFDRLKSSLERAVDAVVRAARRGESPEAVAAYASAETELAYLTEQVRALKHERMRATRAHVERPSFDRVSIH